MVSRRKILSRSRDDLNLDQTYQEDDEDIWHQKDTLFKEHIQEVLDKWNQIDDEIWAKVIVFEKNRRLAKAYARAPVLTINGSEDGFDGMRIGLCGFDNPLRDQKTDEIKRHIGQGVKIKMDDAGNILIRRYSRGNVFIKNTTANVKDDTSISQDILKLSNQSLEVEKVYKLFDMKKFQSNINRELRQAYPDRRSLELQCLSAVTFVKSENELLDCPVWVLIINVVAMDMLKSKLPPMQRPINVKSRPRLPIPDEDPYSISSSINNINNNNNQNHNLILTDNSTSSNENSDSSGYGGNISSNNSYNYSNGNNNYNNNNNINNNNNNNNMNGRTTAALTKEKLYQMSLKKIERPPLLPPRDHTIYSQDLPTPDYDEEDDSSKIKSFFRGKLSKKDKNKKNEVTEDPYYCGLSARVPKFDKNVVKKCNNKNNQQQNNSIVPKRMSIAYLQHPAMYGTSGGAVGSQYLSQQQLMVPQHHNFQQMMWHARSMESGLDYPSEFNPNYYTYNRQDNRILGRRAV